MLMKGNSFSNATLHSRVFTFLRLLLLESYAHSAHSWKMTYYLNSRDYRPCNHLFCPVAFQSSAHANNIEEILRFPICKAVPTLIDSLSVCRVHSHTEPIIIEDRGRRSRVRTMQHTLLSHIRRPFLPLLRLIFAIRFNRSSTARNWSPQ